MQRRGNHPQLGRFAQADTIIPEAGDPLAWDRYAYVMNNPIKHCDTSGHCIDGLTTIPCLIAIITVAGFSGGAAIYQFNVSGNSWWESTEDAIATTKAGVEGMFLAVGAALTAGQVALLAPDAAMWLGSKSNNTGLFSWGVNQAGIIQQTNIITNKISNNEKAISNQLRDTVYNDEVRSPYPIRPSKTIDAWENFLGEGPYNNIGPNNKTYADRLFSSDQLRSIRYGSHEMFSTTHHYHEEIWSYNNSLGIYVVSNLRITIQPE